MTNSAESLLQAPPLGLYLHTPWCVRKCPYCDFNSHTAPETIPEQAYLKALLEDLEADLHWLPRRPVETLFIGGGTPSLMSADFYHQLFESLGKHLDLSRLHEITLEANPGTLEQGRFRAFREAGINRLSIGVQSFNDTQLNRLGRIHDGREAREAIETAQKAGFDRINLDLMHGLPGQSVEDAVNDLRTALTFNTGHISWYQLTLEPNTAFYSRPPELPDESVLADIQIAGEETLREAGLQRYEVSAWSQPDQQCLHNLNYWEFGDYLALGAGAHGKVTQPEAHSIWRYHKTRQPQAYLQRIGSRTSSRQQLPEEDRPLEFMLNALRLEKGVPEALFSRRTGLPLDRIAEILENLRHRGLIQRTSPPRLVTTRMGSRYLNDVLEPFVP